MLDSLTSHHRQFLYHHLEAATAAAKLGAELLDEAEGADVSGDHSRAGSYTDAGLIELRRACAHFGLATLPMEDAPTQAQIDTLRLIQGAAHA